MMTAADRAAQSRRADDSVTALMAELTRRLVDGPVVRYHDLTGWTARGRVKGHRQPRPWITGQGATVRDALADLDRRYARYLAGKEQTHS
jgi:hypothetical protein